MSPALFRQACCGLLALSLAALALPTPAQTAPFSLEQLYRAQPFRGQAAREAAFSHSGRYLAYLWNPLGEPGSDLYVHDIRSGQTQRLSSPALMAAVDSPEELQRFARKREQRDREWAERQAREEAQAAYLRGEAVDLAQWERRALETLKQEQALKKQRDEAQKAADKLEAEREKQAMAELAARRAGKPLPTAPAPAASATAPASAASAPQPPQREDWEWRDELKKHQAKHRLKPTDLYPGVTQFVWAQKGDELVFQYRGQLLRWRAGRPQAEALLLTPRNLRVLAYTPDDQGLVFQDETRVMRARFDSLRVEMLNRELVHPDEAERKYRIEATSLSENGAWMALVARAPLGEEGKPPPKPGRQVEIMGYGERFASARKVDREVSDDKRLVAPMALYIRKLPPPGGAPLPQTEPVFSHPGGDVWFELSPVAWSRDGRHYSFATWEREKELLRVYLGRADEQARPEVVIERRGDVGHELVNVLRPRFSPDGKTLVTVLDDHGWRQPYALDLASRQLRPLLKPGFEAHRLLGFSPDSRQLYLLANADDAAAMNAYRLNLADGSLQALGQAPDYHRNAAVSFDGQSLAAVAGHWAQRPELKLLRPGQPARVLTQSHDPAWSALDRLRPERFHYSNRHGDRIAAYVFKPPGWQPSDRRPAVVYTYGGPLNDNNNVETDDMHNSAYLFGLYMAQQHGYVMVTVDTRGHSNYGRRFASANWEAPGQAQSEDLADLLPLLAEQFGVDRQRIGLHGWSFGGFQTQYTLYTQPELFAAGIAGAGPTEWENYNSWYSGRTIGKVDRSKPNLRKFSLLPLAPGLKRPLLLIHGMQDANVLYQDTVNVYRALLESGKEALVDLFLDPDGEHGLDGAIKPVGRHRKMEAFWLQKLGPAKK
ncbi:dipeptidyl aminopeptidase/acylaminoacyl peptidase [Inhella inkyongensis]|uniref:Dipeptidyl aminopeptidase/acylaminoacyl peptidase n=1 Tax=Inhella inkyongensis TaxID=392593 RepID=A0A840S792_9BURK|nr:prolyl oligopeptidase family serine peptidase [Inhella inkyongensis]MBB5204644.1 dipeptidyl aminopeptidase/acylaminoacyl peptidase [Inhella inkyongensis]